MLKHVVYSVRAGVRIVLTQGDQHLPVANADAVTMKEYGQNKTVAGTTTCHSFILRNYAKHVS